MMSQSYSTKQKLINSAIKIFAEKGFWKTKISDIVKEAGVAQGTFYLYFKSKDHCLKEILLLLHYETLDEIKKLIESNSKFSEVLIYFIKRMYNLKKIAKVFLFEALSSGEEFRDLYFQFKFNFRNILKNLNLSDELITIILGINREIIEQDIIFEEKSEEFVISKFKKIIDILNIK